MSKQKTLAHIPTNFNLKIFNCTQGLHCT